MVNRNTSANDILEAVGGALLIIITLLFSPFLRKWYNRWGASDDLLGKELPGDELVPNPKLAYTHAIDIHAAASVIWPWLVQMGQGRGGLYSYDALENLIGCQIYSAETILLDMQNL